MTTLKQDVVTALRSDKYVQGFRLLRYLNSDNQLCHCIEGVIVDVAIRTGRTTAQWTYEESYNKPRWSINDRDTVSPNELLEQVQGDSLRGPDSLMELNDSRSVTFEDFAEMLEDK